MHQSRASHSPHITILSTTRENINQYPSRAENLSKNDDLLTKNDRFENPEKGSSNPFTLNDSCEIGTHLMSDSELRPFWGELLSSPLHIYRPTS